MSVQATTSGGRTQLRATAVRSKDTQVVRRSVIKARLITCLGSDQVRSLEKFGCRSGNEYINFRPFEHITFSKNR